MRWIAGVELFSLPRCGCLDFFAPRASGLDCTPTITMRLADRGGIDERWLASAIRAENGPLTDPNEGLSLVLDPDGGVIPFDEFVAHGKSELIGSHWENYGLWPM